jgi:hypothetical protein
MRSGARVVPYAQQRSFGRFAALTTRRGRLAQVFCLLAALIVCPMAPASPDEKEGGLEILHMTRLNSAEWIYGKRGEMFGKPTRNDKTEEGDKQRRKVGIGECIDLLVVELKPEYRGIEDDVVWQVIEGDAYFGGKHTADKMNNTYVEGRYGVQLNIRITGNPALTQTVKVKVRTEPTVPGSNPVEKRGFYAYTILEFTRVRPNGSVKSFHWKEQHAEGYMPGGEARATPKQISDGVVLGAWSLLLLLPEPTDVNFGGDAEGKVHVLEVDRNPSQMINGTRKRPPVGVKPQPMDTNPFFNSTFVHTPNFMRCVDFL